MAVNDSTSKHVYLSIQTTDCTHRAYLCHTRTHICKHQTGTLRCTIAGDSTISSSAPSDSGTTSSYYGTDALIHTGDLFSLNIVDKAFMYNEDTQPRLAKLAYTKLSLEKALLDMLPSGWFGVDHMNLTTSALSSAELDVSVKKLASSSSPSSSVGISTMSMITAATAAQDATLQRLRLGDPQGWD